MTSTHERYVSPVSRTVIHLLRPDHGHVTEDITVLLSQIVGSQKSSSTNGDGFTGVKRKKKRQYMIGGTNKKCHILKMTVFYNILRRSHLCLTVS